MELQQQREALRLDLVRANTQGLAIVIVVVGLAVAAVGLAYTARLDANRAEAQAASAEAERAKAEEQLYQTSLAQARAQRLAREMGQRVNGLEAVRTAARIRASPEAREQAIAALALVDLQDVGRWRTTPADTMRVEVAESGEFYAIAPSRQFIMVRRVADDQEVFSVTNSPFVDPSFKFSPNGRYLLAESAGSPGAIRIWDVQRKTEVFTRTPSSSGLQWTGAAFTSDSAGLIHTDSKGSIRLIELETGRQTVEISRLERLGALAAHPQANLLAVECGSDIQLWNLAEKRVLKRIPRLRGIGALAWRADGRLLAIGYDPSIQVWDVEHDRVQTIEGHTREIVRLMFHPQNGFLLSYSWDNTCRLWDPVTGTQLLQTSGFMPLNFGRDGQTLAVWRKAEGLGLYRVHSPSVCRLFTTVLGLNNPVHAADFSPDATLLAATTYDGVGVWNVASGSRLHFGPLGQSWAAAFLDSNSLLAVGPEGLHRWNFTHDAKADRLTFRPPEKVPVTLPGRLGSYALDAQRQHLVGHLGGSSLGMAIDLRTGRVDHTLEGNPSFSGPVFSPDGRWIASGCWDPTVTKSMFAAVWNAHTGVLVTNFPTTKCTVLFSPDSRWLLLGASAEYRLLETDHWKLVRTFPRHEDMVEYGQAAFSNNGQLLALHATDRIMRLVNPATGAELARLNSPDRRILKALRFSSDNRWLAAATEANVQVWDIPSLRQSLGELGLDWDALSLAPRKRESAPILRHSGRWFGLVITPILLAMMAAIGLAISQRRHQAAMMAGYLGVDAMIAARNEQLARAQSELLHTQKMRALGTLAAGIAHDFNNLLSIIRLSNQLTARATKINADVQENAADIEKAVVQGKNVVRSMLGYSRETADEGQPYSLAELVESIVGLLGKQFLSGITLTLELESDLPPVTVSKARVEQILLNLIVNASEAMAGQGKLLLSARQAARVNGALVLLPRPAPGYLEVLVADSGPGISPDTLPRIFEPFFTTKNVGATRGTGLGLSMVFTVAQQDGLGLDVVTAPGQGAAFRILIPVASPPADAPTTSPP